MNLETKITIYKFTPQLFTLTLYLAGTRKVTEVGISLLSATMTVEEWEDNVVIIDHRFCF